MTETRTRLSDHLVMLSRTRSRGTRSSWGWVVLWLPISTPDAAASARAVHDIIGRSASPSGCNHRLVPPTYDVGT